MRLLDLFCGAGGAAMGYHRAGFDEIVGVDIKPQKRYPFEFILGDALEYVAEYGMEFDAIHASPPCQAYSVASIIYRNNGKEYPKLIEPARAALIETGRPYVIENVPGAPLLNPLMLCGLMFDLHIFRHRNFETSFYCFVPEHPSHTGKRIGEGYFSIAGGAGRWKSWGTMQRNVSKGSAEQWREAIGIDWMTRKELTQAIPPAYTEYIGQQLLEVLRNEANQ